MLMSVVQMICGMIKMWLSVTLVHLHYERNVIVITNPTLWLVQPLDSLINAFTLSLHHT